MAISPPGRRRGYSTVYIHGIVAVYTPGRINRAYLFNMYYINNASWFNTVSPLLYCTILVKVAGSWLNHCTHIPVRQMESNVRHFQRSTSFVTPGLGGSFLAPLLEVTFLQDRWNMVHAKSGHFLQGGGPAITIAKVVYNSSNDLVWTCLEHVSLFIYAVIIPID